MNADYKSYHCSISQLTADIPCLSRKSLAREKYLPPKNPLYADNGLGCTPAITRCFLFVISGSLDLALDPHKINTNGFSRSFNFLITASVSCSQPFPRCELASCSLTVSAVLRSKTPDLAQGIRQPLSTSGGAIPRSEFIYLKIFTKDGGCLTPFLTEKAIP